MRRCPAYRRCFVVLIAALLCVVGQLAWPQTALSVAAEPAWPQSSLKWLTGSALEKQLAEPTGATSWSGTPLREAVVGLSRLYQVAILLDRRVDPDQPLNASFRDLPLSELLAKLGERCGFSAVRLGSVVYLGPPEAAAKLRTAAEMRRDDAKRLGAETFFATAPLRWPDLTEPRQLLAKIAADAHVTLGGPAAIPHDLWAAGDLPAMPLVDRLALVLFQFDMTFAIGQDGHSFVVGPMPADVAVVRNYPVGSAAAKRAAQLAATNPKVLTKTVDDKLFVKAILEDQEKIAEPPAKSKPAAKAAAKSTRPSNAKSNERYTVKDSQGQLDRLLTDYGARLGMQIQIDRAALEKAGISPTQRVSFSATNATLDELFAAMLHSTGCTFRRTGNVIQVVPAK